MPLKGGGGPVAAHGAPPPAPLALIPPVYGLAAAAAAATGAAVPEGGERTPHPSRAPRAGVALAAAGVLALTPPSPRRCRGGRGKEGRRYGFHPPPPRPTPPGIVTGVPHAYRRRLAGGAATSESMPADRPLVAEEVEWW